MYIYICLHSLQGFYDVIGEALKSAKGVPRRLPLEAAFKAACDRFRQGGFKFGDPAAYLHVEPNHPHHLHPDFGGCTGCNPPVQTSVFVVLIIVVAIVVVFLLLADSNSETPPHTCTQNPTIHTISIRISEAVRAATYR